MGLINEVDELLREVGWKRHRGRPLPTTDKLSRENLAYELADITKYAISLWQVWGFSLPQMLEEVAKKNTIMEARLQQEFAEMPTTGTRVLLTDLDGTLADLRDGLWMHGIVTRAIDVTKTPYQITTLNADVDFRMDYHRFQELKRSFMENGGFARLHPLKAAVRAVRQALNNGVHVIAYTARPAKDYPRIWLDTWTWLQQQGLDVKSLHIGEDARINLILELADRGCDVVLFDDDPNTVERALNSGLKVVLPRYPYNAQFWKKQGVYPVDPIDGRIVFPFAPGSQEQQAHHKEIGAVSQSI